MSFEQASDQIKMRAGLDPSDFEDLEIQHLLGVMNEEKHGLYGSEEDEDEMDEDQDEDDQEWVSS